MAHMCICLVLNYVFALLSQIDGAMMDTQVTMTMQHATPNLHDFHLTALNRRDIFDFEVLYSILQEKSNQDDFMLESPQSFILVDEVHSDDEALEATRMVTASLPLSPVAASKMTVRDEEWRIEQFRIKMQEVVMNEEQKGEELKRKTIEQMFNANSDQVNRSR